jgi:8-amino-7-oxononanoate synthase
MTALDKRLDALLDDRRAKKRYRSVKEYNTASSDLIDFVSSTR